LRVDPLDIDEVAGALVTACTDEARRDALGAAGRRLARGRTWRRAAELHAAVWHEVAANTVDR
jgi:glycosyltransferase involved in cell wall biosynthesis